MHMCVISTMFGSCFSFLFKLLSFKLLYFYVFSVFIIIFYNKNKVFHFCIFVYLDASLEKEDTPHSFSSRVFFIIISFIFSHFLLFIWFFFLIIFFSPKIILLYFPFLAAMD